jgi:hypothetical protein
MTLVSSFLLRLVFCVCFSLYGLQGCLREWKSDVLSHPSFRKQGTFTHAPSRPVVDNAHQLPCMGKYNDDIDMFFGSISTIKGEEMVQMLRSMADVVPTYAFQLAMKTMKPELEKLMSQIRYDVHDVDKASSSPALVGCLYPRCASLSLLQEIFRESAAFLEGKGEEDENMLSQLQDKVERLSGYTDFFISLSSDLKESFSLPQSDRERLEKISPHLEKLFLSLHKLLQGRSEKSGKALETDRKQSSRISDNKGEKKHES